MNIGGLDNTDLWLLDGLAEMLLSAGRDRAADAIYAVIEAEEEATCSATAAEWDAALSS